MDLKSLIVEELHKPARRNFPRRNTVLKGINDLFQADLVEMLPHSKINRGYKYILTIINCLTKVADAIPLKSKDANSVTNAMAFAVTKNKFKMKHLQTDDGKEFFNNKFSELMKKLKVNHYSTKSEKKAAIIERFNRTLKSAMYKSFSHRGSYLWVDDIPDLISKYNNSYHKSIGMSPLDVNKKNEQAVLKRIKKNTLPSVDKIPPNKFKLGDKVRISKFKNIFTKGYLPNWTNEVFEVYRIQPTNPKTYILKDSHGEILQGGFYGHEMLKSRTGNVYLVQNVLKRKGNKVLIRWLGFDQSHDTWEDINNLIL